MAEENKTVLGFGGFPDGLGLVGSDLIRVREFIASQLEVSDSRLDDFVSYLRPCQGKMLRPAMLLLSGKAFGDIGAFQIEIAAVVEMIHAATLLHDDVIDNAKSRRHRQTANLKLGSASAVLLGDFLLSKAFGVCASFGRADINEIIAGAAGRVCRGEMIQNVERGNFDIDEDNYIDIIKNKSAVFFADCCRLGGISADADENAIEALAVFGLNFGIAFQIKDDLVDIVGDESRAGKTLGLDIRSKNLTLPLIHVLGVLDEGKRGELVRGIEQGVVSGEQIRVLLEQSGSIDYARLKIDYYVGNAVHALESLGNQEVVSSLGLLAESVRFRGYV